MGEYNTHFFKVFLISSVCSCKGLAIGLQNSKEDMLTIFVAVMMHKAIMAFSLGLNIAQSSFSVRLLIDTQDKVQNIQTR